MQYTCKGREVEVSGIIWVRAFWMKFLLRRGGRGSHGLPPNIQLLQLRLQLVLLQVWRYATRAAYLGGRNACPLVSVSWSNLREETPAWTRSISSPGRRRSTASTTGAKLALACVPGPPPCANVGPRGVSRRTSAACRLLPVFPIPTSAWAVSLATESFGHWPTSPPPPGGGLESQ